RPYRTGEGAAEAIGTLMSGHRMGTKEGRTTGRYRPPPDSSSRKPEGGQGPRTRDPAAIPGSGRQDHRVAWGPPAASGPTRRDGGRTSGPRRRGRDRGRNR